MTSLLELLGYSIESDEKFFSYRLDSARNPNPTPNPSPNPNPNPSRNPNPNQVLWALQRRGVAQTTLTIFTSDHAALDKGHCYTQATSISPHISPYLPISPPYLFTSDHAALDKGHCYTHATLTLTLTLTL